MSKSFLAFSSVTKKITMAIVGLFLIVFLLVHLGINLFLLPIHDEHKECFASSAHFMGTNWLVKALTLLENLYHRLRRNQFRVFAHATATVEAAISAAGLERCFSHKTILWQVHVYSRPSTL